MSSESQMLVRLNIFYQIPRVAQLENKCDVGGCIISMSSLDDANESQEDTIATI